MTGSAPPPVPEGPHRFHHGRAIAVAVVIPLAAITLVDFMFDGRVTWWTIGTALGTSAVILALSYFVRFRKLRRER